MIEYELRKYQFSIGGYGIDINNPQGLTMFIEAWFNFRKDRDTNILLLVTGRYNEKNKDLIIKSSEASKIFGNDPVKNKEYAIIVKNAMRAILIENLRNLAIGIRIPAGPETMVDEDEV